MTRRLAALVLSAALVLAAVVVGPCASGIACAMARARTDCCNRVSAGISARCCNGSQQVSRSAPPATAERPMQSSLAPSPSYVAPVAPAQTNPVRARLPHGITPGTAPPGGTLIAQHTSLLL